MATKQNLFKALQPEAKQTEHPHKTFRPSSKPKLMNKIIRVKPEANRQFEILKAETEIPGPELMARALNLLFAEFNKPEIA